MHAAGESSPGNLSSGTYAVVLSTEDDLELMQVADRLRAAGLEHVCIFESDAPWLGQLMAIGVKPLLRSQGRKVLSSIPLYRESTFASGPVNRTGSKPTGAPAGVAQRSSSEQGVSRSSKEGGLTPSSRTNKHAGIV